MNKVEKLSEMIAVSISVNDKNASSVAVLKYALTNLINLAIFMSIVLIISIITGHFYSAAIAIVAFPLLRYFSGGLHFRSMNLCNIISSALVLICVYSSINFWYTGIVLNIIATVILVITAPANVQRSNLKKKYYPVLKLVVALIALSNFIFQSEVLSMVFFIQALTTLPVLQKLLDEYQI